VEKVSIYHGPRRAIVAPNSRCLIDFDADSLHYREAGFLSQDPFIYKTWEIYDSTGDPIWKPHVVNCATLFHVTVDQAVEWMNGKSPQYTFAKNFIYMLLNGGDVPALANAAATAGLVMDEKEVKNLLDNWLSRAVLFDKWRRGLIDEARRTGMVTLPDGRRRRFYDMQWKDGLWYPSKDARKEIFNAPLIGMEVSYTNPRYKKILDLTKTDEFNQWKFIHHEHDGFMVEGPENSSEVERFTERAFKILEEPFQFGQRKFVCPWGAKIGKVWSELKTLTRPMEGKAG